MRRMLGLVSALVLSATVLASAIATAQESSPAPAVSGLPEAVANWAAAWAAGDVEGIVAAYTDDAILEDIAQGNVAHGKEEIRAYIEGQFAGSSDISYATNSIFVAGDWAAQEWTLNGTYDGQLPGLPPGVGQTITIRGVDILELENGKIRVDRVYWDTYGFLVAVGALPAPEAAETSTT